MTVGISLANKCQILFGFAVLLILAAALSVPWVRTQTLVRDYQLEVARQLADRWLLDRKHLGVDALLAPDPSDPLRIRLVLVDRIDLRQDRDPFLAAAVERFRDDPREQETMETTVVQEQTVYRYAKAIRESRMRSLHDPAVADLSAGVVEPDVSDPLRAVLVIDRTSEFAESQLLFNRVFIVGAGVVAGLLAVLVFYLILTKLILSPVRRLRQTAEKVQGGDLSIRAQIMTGDEFEQLSDAFNSMLDRVEQGQAQLRSMNQNLDLKLTELSEANIGLYESNRLKSEFLANVSHELRTPLNSIIGFAELLDELARNDTAADPKRSRYITNILTSGRTLLEMINDLLEMAKIEAGRMEVNVEPTSISDLVEGLIGIMRPQAERKEIALQTRLAQSLPSVETDPGKLQQILFNFLSNAIKFTPARGTVTVTADRVKRQEGGDGVRLSVADTGPGIPYDLQDLIFEKFRQADASHTREHKGTGLGLAICRELATMLGGTVSLVSEPGRGATFYVDLPVINLPPEPQPLMG
jgi:two-component system, NarL family, sensor histidine kinase BarA